MAPHSARRGAAPPALPPPGARTPAPTAVSLVVLKDAVAPSILTPVLFAATPAASCDFALPAGTPPNAIVFGSGYVTIPRMARTGVVLDLAAAPLAPARCRLPRAPTAAPCRDPSATGCSLPARPHGGRHGGAARRPRGRRGPRGGSVDGRH